MSEYLVRGLAHIGIYTDDPQKSAAFYQDCFGFQLIYQKNRGNYEICFVEKGNCVLELVGRGADPAPHALNHFSLEVQGLEALVQALQAKGIVFETEHVRLLPDLFPFPTKNIFLKGPSGERIELFDFTSSPPPGEAAT